MTALIAFAGNSILCRSALGDGALGAALFTWVRLASGALMLSVLGGRTGASKPTVGPKGAFRPSVALAAYATAFSFAYLRLPAGTGALVLFAVTQLTMIGWGLRSGERPRPREWWGSALAMSGLVGLTIRGRTSPDPVGVLLMAAAGVGWGSYSLLGRTAGDPVAANASAFRRAALLSAPLLVLPLAAPTATPRGIALAVLSGTVASGLGYCLWYRALPHLSSLRAAVMQLTVPVITAAAGMLLLGEAVTPRLVLSSVVILGGVGLVMTARR